MRTAKVTAKPGENQRNRETSGDKAARAERRQAPPAALLGRLLASCEK
jgi:hypothetical protein